MDRFDLLHFIHKALRHAMLTFNTASGRTDFSDPDDVIGLTASWSQLRENLGNHEMHEDELMFPLLRADKIRPVVAERLPLTEARRAHEVLEQSAATGKLVLVP